MNVLADEIKMLELATTQELCGTVQEAHGLSVRVSGLPVPVDATVKIVTADGPESKAESVLLGQVIGFNDQHTIVMPFGTTSGIRRGDPVISLEFTQTVRVGPSLLGRVIDPMGRPIDNKGPLVDTMPRPLHPATIDPLERPLIDIPLATGIRAIDALCPVGRGQRIGVIAAPGIGKSVLLGMMARATAADVTVIAMVGERGREVRDFIENQLGDNGLANSVVVCATGDEPPLRRMRSALVATTVAEYFREQGLDVLLIMDSVTRFCQAQRQIGLAAGEPPTAKGYPPSVYTTLSRLLERSGRTQQGSITGFYAVLIEGDPDLSGTDPVSEAARGVLDGHVLLSQDLANRGHWPAIDVVKSISRVSDDVTDAQHRSARVQVLQLVHAYREVEDLVNIGAYAAGSNPDFDLAIACKGAIDSLLQQGRHESATGDFRRTANQLFALVEQIKLTQQQLTRGGGQRAPT